MAKAFIGGGGWGCHVVCHEKSEIRRATIIYESKKGSSKRALRFEKAQVLREVYKLSLRLNFKIGKVGWFGASGVVSWECDAAIGDSGEPLLTATLK